VIAAQRVADFSHDLGGIDELPLAAALGSGRAAQRELAISSATGEFSRAVEVTAFPIVGHNGQSGAIALFWNEPG